MNALDRVFIFLGGLMILASGIAVIFLATPYQGILEAYWTSIFQFAGAIELGLIGIVIFLISIRVLWASIKREKRVRSVTKQMELGEVKISLEAITTMVNQVAEQTKGIRDVKTNIKADDDGVVIYFKGNVMPDVVIPEVSEELSQDIKAHIENISGILVKEVKILVENVSEEKSKKINAKPSSKKQEIRNETISDIEKEKAAEEVKTEDKDETETVESYLEEEEEPKNK